MQRFYNYAPDICLNRIIAMLCLQYGFSFPNYLDRLFGTYEDGERWLSDKDREQLGLPTNNKKKA